MEGNALTPQDIALMRQAQQARLMRFANDLIEDFGTQERTKEPAQIERKAKILTLVVKAVRAVHEFIDRFGETEMDETENPKTGDYSHLSREDYQALYDRRVAEIERKLINLSIRVRSELGGVDQGTDHNE